MFSSRSLSILRVGTVLVVLSTVSLIHSQLATAPTASQDPESIDEIWQNASSKYDSERATLLKKVDSADRQGPFRADWESLQKYEVPDGTRTQSSAFSSTGVSTRFLLSATSGIHEICTCRGRRS